MILPPNKVDFYLAKDITFSPHSCVTKRLRLMLFSYKIDPTDKSSSNTMGQAQPTLLWAVVIS